MIALRSIRGVPTINRSSSRSRSSKNTTHTVAVAHTLVSSLSTIAPQPDDTILDNDPTASSSTTTTQITTNIPAKKVIEPVLAPLSACADIANDTTLRTTSAMRMATHHLFANHRLFSGSSADHGPANLFCVSQACVTFPVWRLSDKVERSQEQIVTQTGLPLHIVPMVSDMWVQRLGEASITFGHSLSLNGKQLAKVTRVFVRTDARSGSLLRVSEEERTELFPAQPDDRSALPVVVRPQAPKLSDMEEVFSVRMGPQHLNGFRFVDPSVLAELSLQGLSSRGYAYETHNVSCQYLVPARVNQTLSCRIHNDLPLVGLYHKTATGVGPLMSLLYVSPNKVDEYDQ